MSPLNPLESLPDIFFRKLQGILTNIYVFLWYTQIGGVFSLTIVKSPELMVYCLRLKRLRQRNTPL